MENLVPQLKRFNLGARSGFVSNGHNKPLDPYAEEQIKKIEALLSKKCVDDDFQIDEVKACKMLALDFDKAVAALVAAKRDNLYKLSELVDKKGHTSLAYQVFNMLDFSSLSYTVGKILENKSIFDYLFLKAHYHLKLKDAASIHKFLIDEKDGGAREIYNYSVVEAAVRIAEDNQFKIPGTFRADITPDLTKTILSFVKGLFATNVTAEVKELIFDKDELTLVRIAQASLKFGDEEIPMLINYIKQSKIVINDTNVTYYLSAALNNSRNNDITYLPSIGTGAATSDYSVEYYEEKENKLEIERENVQCAAQLYYVMTLGDEMETFNVINWIITRYLSSGQIDIRNRETLLDLQRYVFNDEFRDLKTGVIFKRTQAEERKMIYNQVFGLGSGDAMEGMVVNEEFSVLWNRLLIEGERYITKAETSYNPQIFLSREGVLQLVEDLQYNLSTHCAGMSKVAAPIMSRELDFIIQRFLMNDEFISQLALKNSRSYLKVIERVVSDMRKENANVLLLEKKARFSHKIMSFIADYSPLLADDEARFSELVTTIKALNTAVIELDKSTRGFDAFEELGNEDRETVPAGGEEGNWNF